jgi:quinol-cytochrome oxidoreductase complex cytochrome b subunit
MIIPMRRWVRATIVGILAGFAIVGGQATFLRQLPESAWDVVIPVGFCLVVTFLATILAARWIWPYIETNGSVPRGPVS